MVKRGLTLLPAFLILLSLTACWDHVEITDMLMVAGLGLDADDTENVYRATVEIINIGRGGEENTKPAIVEGIGPTIYDAMQDAMVMTGGVMFSNHCKVVVIGEELAHEGIDEVIDIILRSPNLRKTVDIVVARDTTANAILTQKTVKSDIVSFELAKILQSNAKTLNNAQKTGAYQLHEALLSRSATVVSTVSVRDNNGEAFLQVEGTGLFLEDRLLGYLSGEQSKLLRLVTNAADKPVLTIQDDALSDRPFDVKLKNYHVSFAPDVRGDTPSLRLHLDAEALLEGAVVLAVDLNDETVLREVEAVVGDHLSRKLLSLITYVQSEYAADIFGFDGQFERRCRREWDSLQMNWPAHFSELDVSVSSGIRVSGSGLTENFAPFQDDNTSRNALP